MNYDLCSISGRLSSMEANIGMIEKMTGDRQMMIDHIKCNIEKTNTHVNDLKLKIRLMSEQINDLELENEKLKKENEEFKKENETMREQLTNCEQRQLLNIIEELTAKNNKLEYELNVDPTRNNLMHSRNERIVKLLSEAFKYINDPSLMSPSGMFK